MITDKKIIKGKRLLGFQNKILSNKPMNWKYKYYSGRGGSFFITNTIKNENKLNDFLRELSKDDFDYPQSDESWLKPNQKIFQNYTKNKKQKVISTIKEVFHKLVVGCYVQIRNSKITRYVHLTNIHFRNDWEKKGYIIVNSDYVRKREEILRKMNLSSKRLKEELNFEEDTTKWTANGCLIGTWKNPVYKGIKRLYMYYQLITEALRKLPDGKINCDFIINRRDFPIVKSDNTHPYYLGNDKFFFTNPIPILSMCVSPNFADIPIPNREDWDLAMGKHDGIVDNFLWEDKLNKAVWRGNGTNCGIEQLTNQRLKLHQMAPKLKDYLNAGIIGWNPRDKLNYKTKELGIINPEKFNRLVSYMSYDEQLEYKYHLNLDGHVAAFRLGYLLSRNVLVLQVESTSKWTLWFQDKLIQHDIYNLNNERNKKSHYIVVKHDLTNLIEIIDWCRNNDAIVKQISDRATIFYQSFLKKGKLIEYIGEVISKI